MPVAIAAFTAGTTHHTALMPGIVDAVSDVRLEYGVSAAREDPRMYLNAVHFARRDEIVSVLGQLLVDVGDHRVFLARLVVSWQIQRSLQ